MMLVSFCVVARNEEKNMDKLFSMIRMQDYPHEKMEIILVDSVSTDRTRNLMETFAKTADDFYGVQVLSNEKMLLAPGWNLAIENAHGDAVVRVDAHAEIPEDFVSKNVGVLMAGEDVVGGRRPNVVAEKTPWRETLLTAESSMFGSSIAPYRDGQKREYVKSIFHGMYRKQVLDTVGGFDERLGRTEDNEFHYRIRKAGYRICFDPSIISYQHVRSSLKAMIRQKYGNGFWIGRTLGVCPRCFSVFHLVPAAFVGALAVTLLLFLMGLPLLFLLLIGAYAAADLAVTIMAIRQKKFWIGDLALPFIFFMLHMAYGIGTIVGLVGMRRWRRRAYGK